MAENVVKIIVTTDASGAVTGLRTVSDQGKKAGDDLDKASKTGQAGFRALGIATSKLAEDLGVPFRAAHTLGEKVSEFAQKALPTMGMALGVVGVAVAAAVIGWNRLEEAEKKVREETIKLGQSHMDQVLSMDKAWSASDRLREATFKLYQAERQRVLLTGPAVLRAMREEVAELEKKYKVMEDASKTNMMGLLTDELRIKADERQKAMLGDLLVKRKELVQYEETLNDVKKRNATSADINEQQPEGDFSAHWAKEHADAWEQYVQTRLEIQGALYKDLQDWMAKRKQATVDALKDDDEYFSALTALWQEEGLTYEDSLAMEREAYDRHVTAQLTAMDAAGASADQIRAKWAAFELQREEKTAKDKKRGKELEYSNEVQIMGASANLLDQVYKLSHERYKVWFYAARAAAAAESIIQGYLGASKAVGTFWGMPMADVLIGMGYANAAVIAAQTFEGGGGGGGGGSVPTYDANPVTGMPENGGYKYWGYEQSTYGTGWRPGEGPAGGDTYVVHGDVYAQDSDSFKAKVNQAVQSDIKMRGDTAKAIRRYV